MTEEILNDYVNKIQSFNMNEDKRFDAVHIKDAVMAGYNICRSECEKDDLEVAIRIGALEEENIKLKAQVEKMKCCGNCENFNNFRAHCELDVTHSVECHCNNYKLWEDKRK